MHRTLVSTLVVLGLNAYAAHAFAEGLARAAAPDSKGQPHGFFATTLGGTGLNADRASRFGPGLKLDQRGSFIGYRSGNWTLGSDVAPAAADLDSATLSSTPPASIGATVGVGASYGLNLTPKHRLSVDGGMRFGNDADTAPAPTYAAGNADEEASGAGLRLSWRYTVDPYRYFSTSFGYGYRVGHMPEDSDRNETSIGTVFGYRFD